MARTIVAFLGAFFLGGAAGIWVQTLELPKTQDPLYRWSCLALAILLFIAAAFVGRPVKKPAAEA